VRPNLDGFGLNLKIMNVHSKPSINVVVYVCIFTVNFFAL